MKYLFLLSAFFLLFAQDRMLSQNASLRGKIVPETGVSAEFMTVGLLNTAYSTETNSKGEFGIRDIEPGTYTLVALIPGMLQHEVQVSLSDGEQKDLGEIRVQMQRSLDEVTVNSYRNLNEKPVHIGKMNIKPMDLPQSVSVIEKELLDKQQTQYMSDALRNFNGVYQMGNTGGVQQEIAARGFAMGSSNTFKNGIRFNNGILPEMSGLEKLEVMKGSSAILFGNVTAGGVINLVTKKPTFTQGGELSMRIGSFDFYKPTMDVYGLLDQKKRAAFRLNSSYENAGSFRDQVQSQRIYFNPSLAFRLGAKTELLIEGDYLNDNRTADFGVGAINYQLIDLPRSTFLGASWSTYRTEQKSLNAVLSHKLGRRWEIRSTNGIQMFDNDLFGTMRPNANGRFIQSNGTWVRGVQRTGIKDQYQISQLDLTGRFTTGLVKHNLLIGADVDAYSTVNTAYNSLNVYDSINVFNLSQYKQRGDIPDLSKRISTETPVNRCGIYLQDLVDFGKLKVLAGARFSYLETGSKVFTYNSGTFSQTRQYDHATTPRLGLVYQPARAVSIFGSYANSFTPNSGVDRFGNSLAPSYINQLEAGIKSNLIKNKLSANLTAYQIVNSNLAQTDLSNGNINTSIKELAGEVTSKGLELDLMSRSLNGLMLIAGYSYNETRYTKSNTYAVGSLLRYNPMHTANASAYYTFQHGGLKGLNLGFSSVYIGERQAGRSTRVTVDNDTYKLIALPAYTLLDLSVGYSIRQLTLRAKVSNIGNALSYNVHDDNSVNPIDPRQFAATVSYRF